MSTGKFWWCRKGTDESVFSVFCGELSVYLEISQIGRLNNNRLLPDVTCNSDFNADGDSSVRKCYCEAMMPNTNDASAVSAGDISRNFGEWQSKAMLKPVIITHHGRPRLILQSVEEFEARMAAGPVDRCGEEDAQLSQQLSSLMSQMEEGFYAINSSLCFTEVNRVAELYFGFAKKDMIGRCLSDMLPATKDDIIWGYLESVLHTGRPHEQAFRSSVHPGSTINLRAFPFNGGVGVIFNITIKGDHSERDQQWWRALQAAVCADPTRSLLKLNVRGGITFADDHFSLMTGFSTNQLTGLLLTEIVHPRERLSLATTINSTLRELSGKPSVYRFWRCDGVERRLRLTMGAVSDGSVPDGLLVLVVDIDAANSTEAA